MAYSLAARFPPPPKYFTLLDPGSYNQADRSRRKNNAAPFLSKTPRIMGLSAKLWTQVIYDGSLPSNIPNCASMLSKKPRFPYEAFSAEDLEEILCKCGISTPCECPTGDEIQKDVVCQGKVKRRIFKGPTPRSALGDEGLSTPSRKDRGFIITPDGTQHRMMDEVKKDGPPFYDATVIESTAFYQGCKWSHRTARDHKNVEIRPGPADYFLERKPTIDKICAEKVRALKRKTTKQMRFMDMVHQRNILENRPSPATYSPMLPKGTDLQFIGPKAKRFLTSKYDISPGPADHWLRRDFDAITPPDELCHAKLPEPACFGVKANRFRTQREEGPSPVTYHVNTRLCNFVKCPTAPFGSSARRFKQDIFEESDDDDIGPLDKENEAKPCILPTWEFRSKTIRMKPLVKKLDEPSPADLPQTRLSKEKSSQLQSPVPFSSSEERLLPWHCWIPVHGILDTPGPGYYCLEKPRCFPAFKRGPLFRSKRFPDINYDRAPPPNEYKVCNGIETILATHNNKLKCNIKNKYKFKWKQPKQEKVLSLEEREKLMLDKCISLLNIDDEGEEHDSKKKVSLAENVPVTKTQTKKPKMLRSFLYAYPVPI